MFKRISSKLASRRRKPRPRASGAVERYTLSAEVPLGEGQAPLWRIDVQVLSEPQADGEKLRLRAHLQTNLASALKPALGQRAPSSHAAGTLTLAQRAGSLVQRTAARALQVPIVRALAEPLLQLDFNTWIEIDASTASLDSGSRDLLPQSERLAALGIRPVSGGDAPVAQNWAGQAPNGFAQVSVLQMDKRHLPPRLAALLAGRPFALAAAIVNTVEEK
jgi:hypothetical protein